MYYNRFIHFLEHLKLMHVLVVTSLSRYSDASQLIAVISGEYQCLSLHYWGEYDSSRIKVICLNLQRCVKARAYKTLASRTKVLLKGARQPAREVYCCSSDYFNGSSCSVISGFRLIITTTFLYGYLGRFA